MKKYNRRSVGLLVLGCLIAATMGSVALADTGSGDQDQPAGSSEAGPTPRSQAKLQEVVVTATKREERLQDVPISIAVLDNLELERRSVIGMEDYLRTIPGVQEIDAGPLNNNIVIRGISTSPLFGGATVATYFDETSITGAGLTGGGIDVRPVDMARIEVLRGPQGTSYGADALSGMMRLIPAAPKLDKLEGKLSASISDTAKFGSDNNMAQAVVNIPLVTDKLGIRAVGYRYSESGIYRNRAGVVPEVAEFVQAYGVSDVPEGRMQDNIGEILTTGGRFAILWQATDSLDLNLKFLTQKIESTGDPNATTGPYEQETLPIAPQARVRGERDAVADTTIHLTNLTAHYNFGWASLTAVASWVESASAFATDLTRIFEYAFPESTTSHSNAQAFTAETRLASQFDGPIQFLGGLYYVDNEGHAIQTGDWSGDPALNFFGGQLFAFTDQSKAKQHAVFGEVSYQITKSLAATVGGRYNHNESHGTSVLSGVFFGEGDTFNSSSDNNNDTYKAALRFEPTDDSLIYASWSQGFRLGGAESAGLPPGLCDTDNNGVVDGTDTSLASTRKLDSDYLDSYEIGAKLTVLNRRLIIDTSAYHIDWTGLPVFLVAPCGLSYTLNAGAATSEGVEFQANALLTDRLRIDFGAGYTSAKLSKNSPGIGLKDDRLPGTPKVNANFSAQLDFTVRGYKAFARADSFYTGSFYGDIEQTPSSKAGDYIKIDARAGIEIGKIGAEIFVRNLTNKETFTFRRPASAGAYSEYWLRPRTIGLQLSYRFD